MTLTWLLLADVQRVTSDFTEDLLREISLEVRVEEELLLPAVPYDVLSGDDRNSQ